MKIVISKAFGGFGLSDAAMRRYAEIKGITLYVEQATRSILGPTYWTVPVEQRQPEHTPQEWADWTQAERVAYNARYEQERLYDRNIPRDDPALVQVVEELGTEAASGRYAALYVVEIPDDVKWQIEEYDGNEHIAEQHRTWS